MNIYYPVAIEKGTDKTAWGVAVPDLPGCFSAADNGLDEALQNAQEAIALWIEEAIEKGKSVPKPSSIESLQNKGDYEGWVWAAVPISSAWLSEQTERVNITLPRRILALLDRKAGSAGESRSGYIAQLALWA